MEELNTVYLSLGSNLGDRRHYLGAAIELLSQNVGSVINKSSIYETPPFGFDAETTFYNQCIKLATDLSPIEVFKATQDIEIQLGRTTKSNTGTYSSRIIDIDLLYFNDEIIATEQLTIPHSQLKFRKFVLQPLEEIEPMFVDPNTHLTVSQLNFNCIDRSEIIKID